MEKINFTVCGFGRIGKRHAKIIDEYPHSNLSGIIDISPDKQDDYFNLKYQVPFYENIDQFLSEDGDQTDVVVIATPNGLHTSLAKQALASGYHTVIEKPMGLDKSHCENVIYEALRANRRIFVVKQNRYSPTSKWLKKIVEEGTIGEIFMVQVNCYWNRDERYYTPGDWHGTRDMDGGTLFTQFSHFIDIMYWVFGDITNISAHLFNYNHQDMIEFEDSGVVNFDFVDGGMGSINFTTSCWGQNTESSITVVGSKGTAKIGGQYMNEVEYCHIKDYDMPELEPTNPPNDYGPYKGSAANHHYVIENVVETLNGTDSITVNAMEGMKVVEIIENIYNYRNLAEKTKITQNSNARVLQNGHV
jgi:predicted dehydrogenase